MALINHENKEINAKIIYYGPASSGKTTNVKYIYEKMKPEFRGKFKLLNTNSGKMLFFDFMRPDQIGIEDYAVRFHIYTVPGEIADFSIWKTVLKGADGMVFVTDSEPSKLPDNLLSFEKLREYLETLPEDIKDVPCIIQCNKQDIADSTSLQEMKEFLHSADYPMIPASSKKGEGILNTLSTIVKLVIQNLQKVPLSRNEEPEVISEAETVPTEEFQAGNQPAGESQAQIYSETVEKETIEAQQEIGMEQRFSFSPETGVTLKKFIPDEMGSGNQQIDQMSTDIASTPEVLNQDDTIPIEPPIVEEENILSEIQEILPEEEISNTRDMEETFDEQLASFTQNEETTQISSVTDLTTENFQYQSTMLTEPPSIEEPSFATPAGIASEQEFSFAPESETAAAEQPLFSSTNMESDLPSPEINLAGEVELVSPGHIRLPVTIKFGQEIKTLSIDLKLSIGM